MTGQALSIEAEINAATLGVHLVSVLTKLERRSCVVELQDDDGGQLALHMPVSIRLPSMDGARLDGHVRKKVGANVWIDLFARREVDDRYFPRIDGWIRAEYRRVPSYAEETSSRSWLRGLTVADGEPWFRPTPYMNFSASGLMCDDGIGCNIGDLLLVGLQLPTEEAPVRIVGRVVRVDGGESPQVAIDFVDIDPRAVRALTRYTLDRQAAALCAEG